MSKEAIDRKFSKEDIQTAKELARDYHIIIERQGDHYYGHCAEMITVFNDGKMESECKDSVREAIEVVLAYMLEAGIPIPQPKSIFDGEDKYKSFKKVSGVEMHTEDLEHFYIHNAGGSGSTWSTKSIDVLKMYHKKLGEFIEEVEKCKK